MYYFGGLIQHGHTMEYVDGDLAMASYQKQADHWKNVVLRAPQQRKKHSNRLHISKRTKAKHRRQA